MAGVEDLHVPYGEVCGVTADGIVAYSNFSDMHFSGERDIDEGVFMGFGHQCVAFARRFLLHRKGIYLCDIPWAVHIFFLKELELVATGEAVPVVAVRNGTAEPPVASSLLIYPSEGSAIVGHVAGITEVNVNETGGYIRIADQNLRFHKWTGNYSAELRVIRDDAGNYHVQDFDPEDPDRVVEPLGWVTFPTVPDRYPKEPLVIHEKFKSPVFPAPMLERVSFKPTEKKPNWLNDENSAERLFIEKWKINVADVALEQEHSYFRCNMEQYIRFVAAGNQLHQLFRTATKNALQDTKLMTRFGIPRELWPRVVRSFVNQRKTITGRFDFGVCGERMKLYSYNAETSETLFECGRAQQKWAEHVGITESTRGSGGRIDDLLDNAWKQTALAGTVHFVTSGGDLEELYNAHYVAESAARAGFRTKVFDGLQRFSWRGGHVVDSDGELVRIVWKAPSWAAAFADYTAAKAARGADWKPSDSDAVRLCDILLGDEAINVFEPLWKAVTSSKALLPVVYALNPQHPALLETSFELTESLRKKGYVKKPIGGHRSEGVTIVGPDGAVIAQTPLVSTGAAAPRDFIYQEYMAVPVQCCGGVCAVCDGWQIGDHFGGAGISESASVISDAEAPFAVLRMVLTFNPKPITAADVDEAQKTQEKPE